MSEKYDFSVWATEGGGLVRRVHDTYVFVEAPDDCLGLSIGDAMPEEWGLAPANSLAVEEMDAAYFGY